MKQKSEHNPSKKHSLYRLIAVLSVACLAVVAGVLWLGRKPTEAPVSTTALNDEDSITSEQESETLPTEETDTETTVEDTAALAVDNAEPEPEPEPAIEPEPVVAPHIGVTEISLSTYNVSLCAGDSQMPMVTMSPASATNKAELWSSNNTSVATVARNGNITGVAAGSCTVTVRSADNSDVFANVDVTVTASQAAQAKPKESNPKGSGYYETFPDGTVSEVLYYTGAPCKFCGVERGFSSNNTIHHVRCTNPSGIICPICGTKVEYLTCHVCQVPQK